METHEPDDANEDEECKGLDRLECLLKKGAPKPDVEYVKSNPRPIEPPELTLQELLEKGKPRPNDVKIESKTFEVKPVELKPIEAKPVEQKVEAKPEAAAPQEAKVEKAEVKVEIPVEQKVAAPVAETAVQTTLVQDAPKPVEEAKAVPAPETPVEKKEDAGRPKIVEIKRPDKPVIVNVAEKKELEDDENEVVSLLEESKKFDAAKQNESENGSSPGKKEEGKDENKGESIIDKIVKLFHPKDKSPEEMKKIVEKQDA